MSHRLVEVGTSILAIAAATRPVPEARSLVTFHRQLLSCSGCLRVQNGRATSFVSPGATLNRRRARPRWKGYRKYGRNCRVYSPFQVTECMGSASFQSTTRDTWSDTRVATSGKERNARVLRPLTPDQLPDESIYLLDGTAMLFKAFYGRGASGYLAADGATEVGAVLAMGVEFARFVNEVKPRYVAMAFDVGRETTFRREIFPGYKAQRKPHPADLTLQVPLARALMEALGCRTFSLEGFEADDVMATLARWARSVGLGVVVCSSDKDMCQLVRDRVHIMQSGRDGFVVLGDEEVRLKYGVRPHSLPDFFGLVGDRADNIPGVKGIGQKRGSHLLDRFGSLEGIFSGVEEVGKMNIRGSKAIQALLSKPEVQDEALLYREIATLHDEVPLDGMEDLKSSFLLYKGVAPEAESVMKVLGFTAPLRMIQQGNPRLAPIAVDVDLF